MTLHLNTKFLCLTSVAALSVTIAPAYAQLDAARGIADPSRVEQQLNERIQTPRSTSRVEIKDVVTQNVPDNAENINLYLETIRFEGNQVFSDEQLLKASQQILGRDITLADLYKQAAKLTNKYRNDGYILSQVLVPPQTIEGTSVTLQVVEGFVDRIEIRGVDEKSELKAIRNYANVIKGESALRASDLEKHLLLINDLPGIEARSVLSPSTEISGAADLLIIVEPRDQFEGVATVDNFGSRYLGYGQAGVVTSFNSMFDQNERITTQLVYAGDPGYELGFASILYDQPIGDIGLGEGTIFRAQTSFADTEPGFDLEEFDVKGQSRFGRLELEHPFLRSRATNLYGRASLDYRHVRSDNNLEDRREDNLLVGRLGTRYNFIDTIFTAGFNSIDFQISQGMNALGASKDGDSNMSRANGDPQFTKANLDVQRLQRLNADMNLLLAASGQLSADPLLAAEEFGVGGIGFGRGYDPSEIIGDDGFAVKAEWQWNEPYNIDAIDTYQLYAFYDFGKVWNQDEVVSAIEQNSLASTGIGVRAEFTNSVSGGMAFAMPLTRDVQTRSDQDPFIYFNLGKSF